MIILSHLGFHESFQAENDLTIVEMIARNHPLRHETKAWLHVLELDHVLTLDSGAFLCGVEISLFNIQGPKAKRMRWLSENSSLITLLMQFPLIILANSIANIWDLLIVNNCVTWSISIYLLTYSRWVVAFLTNFFFLLVGVVLLAGVVFLLAGVVFFLRLGIGGKLLVILAKPVDKPLKKLTGSSSSLSSWAKIGTLATFLTKWLRSFGVSDSLESKSRMASSTWVLVCVWRFGSARFLFRSTNFVLDVIGVGLVICGTGATLFETSLCSSSSRISITSAAVAPAVAAAAGLFGPSSPVAKKPSSSSCVVVVLALSVVPLPRQLGELSRLHCQHNRANIALLAASWDQASYVP